MKNQFPTDEDRMIYHLTVHKTMISWLINKLQAEGIQAQRTTGNDPNGDILLINPDDIPRVQQLIREIQAKENNAD
jgi:hypothetical protein